MDEPPDESKPNGVAGDEHFEGERPPESLKVNGHKQNTSRTSSDPDAQEMVIASLRAQIQDLFGQVTDLNNKLVRSYDRVSDLEDDLHIASSTLRASSLKISQLELERTQHLSALDDGLLVEKAHVTAELTRLMEKATEEAAQRGQAESARADIEKDLDDLSATLFGQANNMVAEARRAQHRSEEKLVNSERALKGAEEAVSMMQQQMQLLQEDKEKAEREAKEASASMGKGKWVERNDNDSLTRPIQLLSSHLPYQEFLLFAAHLRSVHLSSQQVPAMTTLLTLPFLTRMHTEDSEPTIRLDLAPSLNWLSRRSVLSAIHNGQLTIEPISSTALLQESTSSKTVIPSLNSNTGTISCALCGTPVHSTILEATSNNGTPSVPYPPALAQTNSNLPWSTALFRKSSQSSTNSQLTSTQPYPPQVFIFRLTSSSSSTLSAPPPPLPQRTTAGPSSSQQTRSDQRPSTNYPNPSQSTTIYPLCTSKWCLARLRTTCTLWAFVRTGIVEKIWEEEVPSLPLPTITPSPVDEKPPVPPRRRGLWGMTTALNWGEGDKAKKAGSRPPTPPKKSPEVETQKKESLEQDGRPAPSPPPTHPSIAAAHAPVKRSLPPALPKGSEVRLPPASSTANMPPTEASDVKDRASPSPKPIPTLPSRAPVRPPRRPMTPSNIPLPDSRPHTPVILSHPSSPLAPTATTTPPPLPRRAAARPSRPPPHIYGGSPRPATPSSPRIPPTEATGTKTEQKNSSIPPAQPQTVELKEDQQPSTVPPPTAETSIEVQSKMAFAPSIPPDEVGADTTETTEVLLEGPISPASTSTTSDIMFDAKSNPSSENVTVVDSKAQVDESAGIDGTVAESAKAILSIEPGTRTVKDTDMEEQGGQDVEVGKPDENAEVTGDEKLAKLQIDTKPRDGATKPEDDQATNPREDGEVYVGDTTWEERAWKEIVKLKEEMFWARIGGLQ